MQREVRVVAGIVWRDHEVLLARRPPGGTRGGLWEFPGGKVKPGETDQAALARELQEELNIQVEVGDFEQTVIHPYPDLRVVLVAYHARIVGGALTCLEHDRAEWVPPGALGQYQVTDADIPIQKALMEQSRPS